jgi:spore germination protein KA
VIVVALTGITGLMVPRFRGACLILRFATLFCAATLGLNGYVLSMVALTAYLCGVRSFGLPYTQSLFQFRRRPGKDVVLRAPHFTR